MDRREALVSATVFAARMRRFFTALATALLLVSARAADDLPRRAPGEAMDFEPGLLPDLGHAPAPADTAARLEVAIERAKKSAASGERMFRAGLIAKVEAEKRALKVVRLTAELASTQLVTAKTELETRQAEFAAAKISQEQLDAAQASTEAAAAAAAKASAVWERAQLAAAELNLSRQRQLRAAGIGSKSLVARAQSHVAELKSKPGIAPETPR